MIEHPYRSLEAVVQDRVFPEVDLALRRGRHIDMNDAEWFAFLSDAQLLLETFYSRYDCELIRSRDGYFYLLPTGDKLGRRHMKKREMLVGQALALMFLDPETLKAAGVVTVAQVLELLTSLIGDSALVKALNPRRGHPADKRVAEAKARKEIRTALRELGRLGFVDSLDDDRLRLREALMRFADPVRGLTDRAAAMAQLIETGQVVVVDDERDDSDEHDGEDA